MSEEKISFNISDINDLRAIAYKLEELILKYMQKVRIFDFSIHLILEDIQPIYITDLIELCKKNGLNFNIFEKDGKIEFIISKK